MRDIMVIALNKETNEEDIVFLDDVLWELSQHQYWVRTLDWVRTLEWRLNDGESLETDTHEYRLTDEYVFGNH